MSKNHLLEAALDYARRGWPVNRLRPGTKEIDDEGKTVLASATRDEKLIREWWRENPRRNVGVVPGPESGFCVLDVDVKNGANGLQALAALQAAIGPLPKTRSERTPSGGLHYFFGHPGGPLGNRKSTGRGSGLEWFGAPHNIATAPSLFDGNAYEVIDHSDPAPLPDALIGFFKADAPGEAQAARAGSIDVTDRNDGNRTKAAFAFACSLQEKGIPADAAWQMLLTFNSVANPPLSERELRQIHRSALRYRPGAVDAHDFAGAHPGIVEELRALRSNVLILPNNYVPATIAGRIIFERLGALHELFMRGGRVVEVVAHKGEKSLSVLTPDAFRSRLNRGGRIVKHAVKHDTKKSEGSDEESTLVLVRRHASRDNAAVLLETLEAQEYLPHIELVTRCALAGVVDGKFVVHGPGYNEEGGGVMVCTEEEPPLVPITEAVPALLALLDEFKFAHPSDKSRAMAGFIGPALRMGKLVAGHAPVNGIEANESQTGKGYLGAAQCAVYDEAAYTVVQKDGGVGSFDESIGEGLASGHPIIALDNVRGLMDSRYLESGLTSYNRVPVRLPRKGEITVDVSRISFQLTSNGIETTKDLGNRILLTTLAKQPKGYQFKCYPEGDLLAHIRARHTYYLGCVFAVVRTWVDAGRPMNPTTHSFRQWVGSLDWIAQNVMELPPLLDHHHDGAIERVSNPALSWLRSIAITVDQRKRLDQELSASALVELSAEESIPIPGLRSENTEEPPRAVGRVMARCFVDGNEVQVGAFVVQRMTTTEYNVGRRENQEVRRYRFLRGGCGPEEVDM
jgi:hypothetical protein